MVTRQKLELREHCQNIEEKQKMNRKQQHYLALYQKINLLHNVIREQEIEAERLERECSLYAFNNLTGNELREVSDYLETHEND